MKFSVLVCVFTVLISFPNFDLNTFVTKEKFYVDYAKGIDINVGSESKPWKTIDNALWTVSTTGGAEIIVADGAYNGAVVAYRGPKFESNVLVRAKTPYHVGLVDTTQHWVLYLSNATNIIFHGFEMYATQRGAKDYLVQIENCTNIVLENCIIHDSYRQVVLKVNEHSSRTVIRGCIFYNQPDGLGGAHLIEANIVYNTIIEDCIFFNDESAPTGIDRLKASSFLAIKATTEQPEWSDNQIIRRNVFLNWVGAPDQSFIELGGDGQRHKEVVHTVIENNLFINNNDNPMAGLFSVKGNVEDVQIISNTATGHIEHNSNYGYVITIKREPYSFENKNIRIINNIFSDPSGDIGVLYTEEKTEDGENALTRNPAESRWLHNLWFGKSGGPPAPTAADVFNQEDRVTLDPKLPTDFSLAHVPRFDRTEHNFGSSESRFPTIEEARRELVTRFAIPPSVAEGETGTGTGTVSSILNAGRTAFLPYVDILGNPRTAAPGSIGAYEVYVGSTIEDEDDGPDEPAPSYSQSSSFKTGIIVIIVVVAVVVVLMIVIIVITLVVLRARRSKKKQNIILYLQSSHLSM